MKQPQPIGARAIWERSPALDQLKCVWKARSLPRHQKNSTIRKATRERINDRTAFAFPSRPKCGPFQKLTCAHLLTSTAVVFDLMRQRVQRLTGYNQVYAMEWE